MEIRFNIQDDYIKDLQKQAGGAKPTQLASEALALFNWAINEVKKGRKIVAYDEEKNSYKQIVSPILDKASKKSSAES